MGLHSMSSALLSNVRLYLKWLVLVNALVNALAKCTGKNALAKYTGKMHWQNAMTKPIAKTNRQNTYPKRASNTHWLSILHY